MVTKPPEEKISPLVSLIYSVTLPADWHANCHRKSKASCRLRKYIVSTKARTTLLNTKRILAFSCLAAFFVAASLLQAQTEPDPTTIHVCADSSSLCGNSNSIIPVNDSLPTLAITVQGDTGINKGSSANVWLVVMVPNSVANSDKLSFSANGTSAKYTTSQNGSNSRFDGLGFTVGATMNSSVQAPLDFAHANGAASATGFSVYLVNLGSWNMSGSFAVTFSGSGLPQGTVIWAFFTGPNGQKACAGNSTTCAVNSSPWSESVGIGTNQVPLPEPAETALLAFGLMFIAGFRKKLRPI